MANLKNLDMWENNIETFSSTNYDFKEKTIKTLIRQSARWAVAAGQDESPMIACLHANYAAGYLWALRDIATDSEIEQLGDIDVLKFKKKIIDVQDKATKYAALKCPEYKGEIDDYLSKISGES